MADIKNWSSLGPLSPEWTTAATAAGGSPDLGMFPDIPSMRAWFEQIKAAMEPAMISQPFDDVREQDHQVKMRDGHEIVVRTYHPKNATAPGALGVVYHGGGWCIGGLVNEELLCRRMAREVGMTVANVDYRMGPEWKFPTAHEDCYDATKWAAENASKLGADPSKGFTIGGTSAGGNITASISHLWRDDKLSPPITGCHLMIPALCDESSYPEHFQKDLLSKQELPNAPILNHAAMKLFSDNYIPAEQRGDPLFSPLLWKSGHKGLPAQYFQICGADPLRDEALVYERVLREEDGVKTKVDMYAGQPHGFWSIFPTMEASKKFVDESVKGVRWLLEQS
ncbi:Putative alpha/beta hydrolase-3 [Septoria linicola]|uniref:Alpha/beta hydrolase-3 n=1 Tax=Septoria linicola TaxID=215465 RepID=A0A9Q9EKF4_9PEZI|nr:putative alpha/beta hydrolase-3 [Septoria linicola]USW53204.1 Putative alpha/beta hydrolase-3 [Septoria linicola]